MDNCSPKPRVESSSLSAPAMIITSEFSIYAASGVFYLREERLKAVSYY
jgi:hypothetical protein